MFKHILVPTDGSELSAMAVQRAVRFAREAGAKITFYYAKPEFPIVTFAGGSVVDSATMENFSRMADEEADQILSAGEKLAQAAGVSCARASSVNNMPYRGIIDTAAAAGCDLIFMASHGRRGLDNLLLGSETHRVLTHTTIPVLVYR